VGSSVTALDSIYITDSLCLRNKLVVSSFLNTNDLLIRTSKCFPVGAVIHWMAAAISLGDQITDVVYKCYHPSYHSTKLAIALSDATAEI